MIPSFVSFETGLRKATTPDACVKHFLAVLQPFRIDTLAAGEVDLSARELAVFFAIAWPEDWRKFYLSQRLYEHDPVVESLSVYDGPFTWREMRGDKKFIGVTRDALERAAAHGWEDGLVVPIPRGGQRFGLVSLVARTGAFDAEAKALLSLMSIAFHQRVRTLAPLTEFPRPPAGLTARERECLQLIAGGFSDREIAEELGIGEATARGYYEFARRKLKGQTRAQTIAKAVSLGVITA